MVIVKLVTTPAVAPIGAVSPAPIPAENSTFSPAPQLSNHTLPIASAMPSINAGTAELGSSVGIYLGNNKALAIVLIIGVITPAAAIPADIPSERYLEDSIGGGGPTGPGKGTPKGPRNHPLPLPSVNNGTIKNVVAYVSPTTVIAVSRHFKTCSHLE